MHGVIPKPNFQGSGTVYKQIYKHSTPCYRFEYIQATAKDFRIRSGDLKSSPYCRGLFLHKFVVLAPPHSHHVSVPMDFNKLQARKLQAQHQTLLLVSNNGLCKISARGKILQSILNYWGKFTIKDRVTSKKTWIFSNTTVKPFKKRINWLFVRSFKICLPRVSNYLFFKTLIHWNLMDKSDPSLCKRHHLNHLMRVSHNVIMVHNVQY